MSTTSLPRGLRRLAAVLAAASSAAAMPALANTYSFQHGVAGYFGSADTQLGAANADFAFGSELEVSVDASDGGAPSQVLLRFGGLFGDGPGQIGADQIVTSATLTLLITSSGSGILFHDMLQPWDEATVTWNSAVGGIQADGVEAVAMPFLSIGANDGNSNIESGLLVLDVTDSVRRQQLGLLPGHGWALLPFMPDGTNGVDFYTREWSELSERPLLTVVTVPVPEPSAALLALAGLLGVTHAAAAARRRRSG